MLKIPIFLFNTKGRKLQEFKPITKGIVKYYSCGPTVYDYAHIGNMFSFTFSDLLRRLFTFWGYKVVQVMNITDVGHLTHDADMGEEDRIMKALGKWQKNKKKQKIDVQDIIDYYTAWFVRDLVLLNVKLPTFMPFASHHVKEMQDLIQVLLDKGFAYKTSSAIYYHVPKFKDYTKLYPQALEEKLEQARKEVKKDPTKKHPADFRLWQLDQPNHIMQWETSWGKGFPGWHIECSAMSMKYLGYTFDIHTGGIDHVPVHHTNEIAQSEACTGKEFANYWLHHQHVKISGEKMSKSLGNFATLQTLLNKGYKPWHIRMFFTLHHYRSVIDFNKKDFEHAVSMYEKLEEFYQVAKWRLITPYINDDKTLKVLKQLIIKLFPEYTSWLYIAKEYNKFKSLENIQEDRQLNWIQKYLNKLKGRELPYINFVNKQNYEGQNPKEPSEPLLTYSDSVDIISTAQKEGLLSKSEADKLTKDIIEVLQVIAKDLALPQMWSKVFKLLKTYYNKNAFMTLTLIAVAVSLSGVMLNPFLLPVNMYLFDNKALNKFISAQQVEQYKVILEKVDNISKLRENKEYDKADKLKQELLKLPIVKKIIDMPNLSIAIIDDF